MPRITLACNSPLLIMTSMARGRSFQPISHSANAKQGIHPKKGHASPALIRTGVGVFSHKVSKGAWVSVSNTPHWNGDPETNNMFSVRSSSPMLTRSDYMFYVAFFLLPSPLKHVTQSTPPTPSYHPTLLQNTRLSLLWLWVATWDSTH